MKDNNKNTKIKQGSCCGSNKPTEIINNYINQREEIIFDEGVTPPRAEDIFTIPEDNG